MTNRIQRPVKPGASLKNPQLSTVRYCLYARKSMEAEERQALSINSQLNEMKTIAERDNLTVVATRIEAHSAKAVGQRKVFNQIISEIKQKKYNGILTWAPDRLSRNAGDLGQLVDLMDDQLLLEVRTYNQTFSNSPNEKFLLMILGSQAKLENDNRGINVKRGLRAVVEKGLWPALAPIGYKNLYRSDKPGHLKIDPARGYVIKLMYEKAVEGWSHRKIRHWLQHELDFISSGGKHLSLSSVQRILTNSFYYGEFEYPRGGGKWCKGQHQPLITKDVFDQCQKELNKRRYQKRIFRHAFAYTRMIRCGLCGSNVSASEKFKPLKDGSISKYVYYGCNRHYDHYCKALYLREDDLVNQFCNMVDNLSLDDLGVRGQLDLEVERFYRFHRDVLGNPGGYETDEERDIDTKKYIKYLLTEGTLEEKRAILKNLKSKLMLKDKKIYLDA